MQPLERAGGARAPGSGRAHCRLAGLAESELDALRNLPFVTLVGPGPRVLRSDTAALAALAC